MQSEDRIARMEAEGSITPEQAAMLRESLGNGPGAGPGGAVPARRRFPLVSLGLLGAALLAGIVLMFAGGGEPQQVQEVSQVLNQVGAEGQMSKSLSTILAVVVLLIVPFLIWVWLHNGLVSKEERVFEAWAQTESNFQRRADLIPALVETVSRYLQHERQTLGEVTETRSDLADAVDALIRAQAEASKRLAEEGVLEREEAMAEFYAAETALAGKVRGLFAVVEAYPELRSSDQFLELQAQIEGTENRINVARLRFNEAVRDYNAAIRRLPGSLVAQVGSFHRKAYFQAEEGASEAPALQFQ